VSEKLEFTGERFTPECEREIWYEHLHRYAFATRLCAGLNVLDAASGEGYGSALLSTVATKVTGIDLSEDAVEHARQRYADHANLEFVSGDVTALPFVDDSFDCVVSFETIEHVQAQEQVLAELRRVLRPDGFMLMSSPDKAVYTDAHGTDNPHHVRELYRDEFETLLATRFPATRLLGQKLLFHSVIWSPEGVDGAQLQSVSGQRLDNTRHITHAAMYWLALCAAGTEYLPDAGPGLWLFDDTEESVYRHYQGEIRRNMNAGGIIAERDHEIETLRRELESARSARSSWLGRLFRR
jgi:SAM-dependent methyltransferase